MRSVPLLLAVLIAAAPLASARIERENEVMGLVTVHRHDTVLLVWQPTPGAIEYGIYREAGPGEDDLVLVGATRAPFYVDDDAPDASIAYVVLVISQIDGPANAGTSPQQSSCVSASTSGAQVTVSNCLPERVWGEVEL